MTTDTSGHSNVQAAATERFRPGFLKGNPQLTKNGEPKHLLPIEGLRKSIVTHIRDTAEQFVRVTDREGKKVPLLRGRLVFNLSFENSACTRTTFKIAATRLSADVLNLNINASSTSKGESLLDNTGDGRHAYPSQDLLDMYMIRHYKHDFTQLRVAIVSDILHSRMTRSDIHALTPRGGCPRSARSARAACAAAGA